MLKKPKPYSKAHLYLDDMETMFNILPVSFKGLVVHFSKHIANIHKWSNSKVVFTFAEPGPA